MRIIIEIEGLEAAILDAKSKTIVTMTETAQPDVTEEAQNAGSAPMISDQSPGAPPVPLSFAEPGASEPVIEDIKAGEPAPSLLDEPADERA